MAQRVGRGKARLFHDHGTGRGWVISSTPRPQFTPAKDTVHILQEAGWAPEPVWTDGKSRPHRDVFITNVLLFSYIVYIPAHCNRHCHRSCRQSVHRTRYIITPPHHRAFRTTFLSYTILVHLAYISLSPLFTLHKNARLTHFAAHVQHWVTPIPPPNGPGTAYARMSSYRAGHAPYSHGSISVPLIPLPKHCNKNHPDAAASRCVPLVGSWS